MLSGALVAAASAVSFGVTTPLVQRFGRSLGPFTTAALLYTGAALVSLGPSVRGGDESLRRGDALRLSGVAALGAVCAPTAMAWGLQHTNGVAAALLLNLEAPFTVLFARLFWAEPLGGRVGLAVGAMLLGGTLLVFADGFTSLRAEAGGLAVIAATVAWAADNVLSRPLADRNPTQVVLAKSALGSVSSLILSRAFGEAWPNVGAGLAVALCGAIGYGMSLKLYLRAQRAIGAARSGSIFASAPFAGAALAWVLGQRGGTAVSLAAGGLCAFAVWLHLTEHHDHVHTHPALEHDHPHRHDDRHHLHGHDHDPIGEHSHPHTHEVLTHSHPHALDLHHRHRH
ncbi:MAG: DMT family transporter [Polyangiaceae bacterium]